MRNAYIHHNWKQNKKREIDKRKKEKPEVKVNEIATNKKLKLDDAAGAENTNLKHKAIPDIVYNKSSKANSNKWHPESDTLVVRNASTVVVAENSKFQ